MFEVHNVTIPFGEDRELILETGKVARQAQGSIMAKMGGTVVMANVVHSPKPMDHMDFFPLMVDYREKHYAAGRIPGNFFRREARPGTLETINARLIDRTIRPLFPKGFRYDVQVYLTIVSMDQINPASVVALNAASAALAISDIPFNGPVGAVRMAYIDDKLVRNPTFQEQEESSMDLILGGTADAVTMVESGCDCLKEEVILKAFEDGHKQVQIIVEGINELVAKCGKPKMEFTEPSLDESVVAAVNELAVPEFPAINKIIDKVERDEAVAALKTKIKETLVERFAPAEGEEPQVADVAKQAGEAFGAAFKKNVRMMIINDKVRVDGRKLNEIRQITIEPDFLPMAHGSVLFTRGQTQSLGVATLGTIGDQQRVDDLRGMSTERFMLHYNFPSYCVGETRRIMGPGRRELGHGMLAQRGLTPILPAKEDFPYTIRIVSEITESNGSSSMASVCSGCLSLMNAGVPIKAPVAGIAMGLIKEDDNVAVLTDILGMEDHLGDMDFKVTGTRDGVTALQMDIKCDGLTLDIMKTALNQAHDARISILDTMAATMPETREELSPLAPRIETMKIDVEMIGALIGPSGKHIRGIAESTGAKIDVEDDGTVYVATADGEAMAEARRQIDQYTASPEIGKTYTGKVVRITDFGAFVEILPKKDGLVHISEMDFGRVEKVTDVCREGDMMKVKCIEIDPGGKVRLSRKQALADEPGFVAPPESERPERSERPRRSSGGSSSGRPPRRGGSERSGPDRGGVDRGGRGSR